MKTQAIVIHETGGPEVMRLEEVDLPPVGPGEVRVRHTAIGFNMIDTYRRKGLYPMKLPYIPGSEAAGVVEEAATDVDLVRPGDRVVYASSATGAYACQSVIRAADLVRIPGGISDESAAACMLKGMTAWMLLHGVRRTGRGDDLLVYAAAGGVGTLLCQWAKSLSARVIGVVGSDEKADIAKRNGCDEVIVYSREDIAAAVRNLTGGRGVDVVYDSLGQATFNASLDCLKPRGLMVSYDNATGTVPPFDILELSRKGSLFLTRPQLFSYLPDRAALEQASGSLFGKIASGEVRISVNQRYPLHEAAEAHTAVEAKRTTGATVVLPEA